MQTKIILLLVAAILSSALAENTRLYRVHVENPAQIDLLRELLSVSKVHSVADVGAVGHYEIGVEDDFASAFEEFLQQAQIIFELVASNILNLLPNMSLDPLDWEKYHDLKSIYAWMDLTVIKNFPNVLPFIIGYSYEGRPIKGLRISFGPVGNKKAIIMDSNIHAIEWISSATTTCFTERLLNSDDPQMKHLRESYVWYVLPMLNPDGYVYTYEVNPLWRKNRKPTGFSNSSGICYGTDLNRNFDYFWKENGYNVDVPCDHFYGGNSPASEPETQAIQNFLLSLEKGFARIYLAFHSFGNLVLFPYGHTTEILPSNIDQMNKITRGFAEAARVKYGTDFIYGPSGAVLYPVSGAAKDYAYEIAGIPYSVTMELRDRGEYGFFLPPNQILEVCDEITDGLIGMVRAAEEEGLFD